MWTKQRVGHDGAGDFPRWIADACEAPRRTLFIKGNHEDFEWLDARPTREVHPGLHHLRNGQVTGHALEKNMEAGVLINGGPVPQALSDHLAALIDVKVIARA